MKHLLNIFLILSVLALAACSDDDVFTVRLKVNGLEQQSVTMTWIADGAVKTIEAHPLKNDGVVKFTGTAREPAIVEFRLTSSDEPIATVIASNGEEISCETTLGNPFEIKVKGSDATAALATFLRDNAAALEAADAREVNKAIAKFVTENPRSLASTALLATRFSLEGNELLADSLMTLIDIKARPLNIIDNFNSVTSHRLTDQKRNYVRSFFLTGLRDSLYNFTPSMQRYSLLAFTGKDRSRRDTVERALAEAAREFKNKRVKVVEISLLPDSAEWRRTIGKNDSTGIDRTWAQGSVAAPPIQRLNIFSTPYFILADSAGRQVLRTPSVTAAVKRLRQVAGN